MPNDKSDQKVTGVKKKPPRSLTVDVLGGGLAKKAAKKVRTREQRIKDAVRGK